MPRVLPVAALLIVTTVLVTACSGSGGDKPSDSSAPSRGSANILGTYVKEGSDEDYLEIRDDGHFFLSEDGVELEGAWSLAGSDLTLTLPTGVADRVKVVGNVIVDDDEGERWVKKGSSRSAGKAPTSSKSVGVQTHTLSEAGRAFIARHEGLRLTLYEDPGNCTIGYGHLVHKGKCNGTEPAEFLKAGGITENRALELLRTDARTAERAVNSLVTVPLNQAQFDALVSFTYNLGEGNLRDSELLKQLNAGNYGAVPEEMNIWVFADGQKLAGLVNRRRDEGILFKDGSYDTKAQVGVPQPSPKPAARLRIAFSARSSCRLTFGGEMCTGPDIYTASGDGTEVTRIAEAGKLPLWSRDGSKIAFVSTASGDAGALYVVNRDGGVLKRVLDAHGGLYLEWRPISWAPAGDQLLVENNEARRSGRYSMRIVNTDGPQNSATGGWSPEFDVIARDFSWESAGPRVSYIQSPGYVGYPVNLYIMDLQLGIKKLVGSTGRVRPASRIGALLWAPDGRRLVHLVLADDGKDYYQILDTDVGTTAYLTPLVKSERFASESTVARFSWSPRGERLAYQTADGTIYLINSAGTGDKKVAQGQFFNFDFPPYRKSLLEWSPDGKWLAFNDAQDSLTVRIVSSDGGQSKTLGRVDAICCQVTQDNFQWAPDSTTAVASTLDESLDELKRAYVLHVDQEQVSSLLPALARTRQGLKLEDTPVWSPAIDSSR